MAPIDNIIKKMGYYGSKNLYYIKTIDHCHDLSIRDKNTILQLKPYAFYVVEGKVIILFFDDLISRNDYRVFSMIWNAQIPIIISDEGSDIVVYDGKSLNFQEDRTFSLEKYASIEAINCNEQSRFSFWNITDDLAEERFQKSIKGSLNDQLINNLKFIIKELREKYQITSANRLVLQILFIRYLIDRGISIGYEGFKNDANESRNRFLEIIQDRKSFVDLIRYCRNKYEGDLFYDEKEINGLVLTDDCLSMLYRFLAAIEELDSNQLTLFPLYDFSIIPVELISLIYEMLIGEEKKRHVKAYYTPMCLADYVVNNTVGKYLDSREGKECMVLDPSCGSGIFLVKALQRILIINSDSEGYLANERIVDIIRNNIYGVDCNEEAVDVTIFSLYITLLDYINLSHNKSFKLPSLKNTNICVDDFFNNSVLRKLQLNKKPFKFIIGNPPWGRVEQLGYKDYYKNTGRKNIDTDISSAFLLKVIEMGGDDTEYGLIMPSKFLYKKSKATTNIRHEWVSSVQIKMILETAAIRRELFQDAIAPAVVLVFRNRKNENNKVEYISLKPNTYLKQLGQFIIEPDDVKYIDQNTLNEKDEIWKALVYGGYWDYELINDLKEKFGTVKEAINNAGLIVGKGMQTNLGDGNDVSDLCGRRILDSKKSINHFTVQKDSWEIFQTKRIHRPRDRRLFEPPYVLLMKGLDCTDYSLKAAYSEDDYLYREAITGIKGDYSQKNILLNLCGLANSSLYAYFTLIMGSSAGIEREQMFNEELYDYPYTYSEKLVDIVKSVNNKSITEDELKSFRKTVDDCVLEMFELNENEFVNYALNISIPELCKKYENRKCDEEELIKYANTFSKSWESVFSNSDVNYRIDIFPMINAKYAAVSIVFTQTNECDKVQIIDSNQERMGTITQLLVNHISDNFYQIKNSIEFSNESITIIKNANSKYWHPAIAIKDCYKIMNAILSGVEVF